MPGATKVISVMCFFLSLQIAVAQNPCPSGYTVTIGKNRPLKWKYIQWTPAVALFPVPPNSEPRVPRIEIGEHVAPDNFVKLAVFRFYNATEMVGDVIDGVPVLAFRIEELDRILNRIEASKEVWVGMCGILGHGGPVVQYASRVEFTSKE